MSIMLAGVAPDRALLAVDTLGFLCTEDPRTAMGRHCSKLLVLPQLGAALAVSGTVHLAAEFYYQLLEFGRADFDLVANMVLHEDAVARAERRLLERVSLSVADDVRDSQQLVALVGYSAELRRLRCVAANRKGADWRTFEAGWLISPPVAERLEALTVDSMLRLAAAQVQAYNDNFPIGGGLVIAELTREGITTTAHWLPRRGGPPWER